MTFKEARAEAREMNGSYIGPFEEVKRGWFVQERRMFRWYGPHPRAVFYVRKDGSLEVVKSTFAQNYQKKYFANMQKKLDKWKRSW